MTTIISRSNVVGFIICVWVYVRERDRTETETETEYYVVKQKFRDGSKIRQFLSKAFFCPMG